MRKRNVYVRKHVSMKQFFAILRFLKDNFTITIEEFCLIKHDVVTCNGTKCSVSCLRLQYHATHRAGPPNRQPFLKAVVAELMIAWKDDDKPGFHCVG